MNIFEKLVSVLSKGLSLDEEKEQQKSFDRETITKEVFDLSEENDGGMRFFKDKETGNIRWLAIFSSNYLDDDNPPDILSEESHKDFIERVEKGLAPYPELWHWHTKGTTWGQTDWLAYDDDYGVMWASGLVNDGHEKEALLLMKSDTKIGVSHGMKEVKYSPDDDKVVTRYTTYEISDLPLRRAANKMTAMFIAERNNKDMEESMISEEKLKYLRQVGLSEDEIEQANSFGKEQSEKFSGRMRKEAENEKQEEVNEEPQDAVEEKKDDSAETADLESEKAEGETSEETEKSEEGKEEVEEVEESKETSVDEETMKAIIKQSFEEFGTGVVEAFERIESRLKELEKKQKSAEEREKQKELEPLSKSLVSRLRAVGSKEAELKEGDETLNDKPDEADEQEKSLGEYSSASDLLMDIFGGK